jgi:predicted GTPase
MRTRTLIMGAAGRDFHNFNVFFRDNSEAEVVAFTATQIPGIGGRTYPPELAGKLYPKGIPIHDEKQLPELISQHDIEQVIFAYSDISHETLMHKASLVLAAGADFRLMGMNSTAIKSIKPVIAVCAVRTGSGKSQTTRQVGLILKEMGNRVVVIRHPMPYGDLVKQAVQRYADYTDLDRYKCTIEEREEYEPHLDVGHIVYAGVDYEAILRQAENEADIILWDGGNNDLPFYKPDLHIVVADPHRAGHEVSYHPGEANFRAADVIIINKVDTADYENILTVRNHAQQVNPKAMLLEAASPLSVDHPELVRGKRVLVVEDGPTLTHGEMRYGAGYVAAQRFGAAEIIDPRPFAVGSIKEVYAKYSHVEHVLPAMGYGVKQVEELEATINHSGADLVMVGTPIDLRRLMKIKVPMERVRYDLQVIGTPKLHDILDMKLPVR